MGKDKKKAIRKLYYSDNLPVLRRMESASVDLIYLDPPFNSNRAYNIIYPNDMGQIKAFVDTWSWTPQCDEYLSEMKNLESKASLEVYNILSAFISAMDKIQINAYLVNMTIRIIELQRILKPTGSIYLHCDPTASHYLKVVMDHIFGGKNFRNEIVWCYRGGGVPKQDFARKHDVLLRYSKGKSVTFNVDEVRIPYSDSVLESDISRYDKSYRSNKIYEGYRINEGGKHPEDWWPIQPIMPSDKKERLGYPTQKPLALLDRIIRASSNRGDIVLDPFCGCGTSIAAAEILKRQWIGIDITYSAIAAIKERFKRQKLNVWGEIEVLGEPKTVQDIETNLINNSAARARKEFEKWCVTLIGGLPNEKMGADGGIDGRIAFGNNEIAIISVKSGHVNVRHIRELGGLLKERNKIGIFVTREKPTRPMTDFADQAGIYEPKSGLGLGGNVPRIQILTLDDILSGSQPQLP